MAPKKRKSKLSKNKAVADDSRKLKIEQERDKYVTECNEEPVACKKKNTHVATSSSVTPSSHKVQDGRSHEGKREESTPGRKYTSHFRPDTMATGSSPSLLDLTVTYDYSCTDVNIDDNCPRPTIQQLTQLFPFKENSKALSSTSNLLSILHELSPAHSVPPTKRAKLSTAFKQGVHSETTPTSSAHPPKSKLDFLLTQLQQRVSETNQEKPHSSDNGSQNEILPHSSTNLMTETCQSQKMKEDENDDMLLDKGDSLESSDNEEMLFWTQAATELDYGGDFEDDPVQQERNEVTPTGESATRNATFDPCQPWDTEADDFIDQLLITGAEGETISSSPDPLADANGLSKEEKVSGSLLTISKGIPISNTEESYSVQMTAQTTVYTNMTTTDLRSCDNDRCPTPPLPLTGRPFRSHQQLHAIKAALSNSPKRPPSWKLAQEDARSTPPISPLTSEPSLEKISPLQEIGSPFYQSGDLEKASSGQGMYGRDCLPEPSVNCRSIPMSSSVQVSSLQRSAPRSDLSYHYNSATNTSDVQSSKWHSQVTDMKYEAVQSTQTVYKTEHLARGKNLLPNDEQNIKGNFHNAAARCRTVSNPISQSSQCSRVAPLYRRDCSNTEHLMKGNVQIATHSVTGTHQCRPVVSAVVHVSKPHQCTRAEIEHKRELARSKLQAKKKASLHNYHH